MAQQNIGTVKNSVVQLITVGIFGAMVGAAVLLFLAEKFAATSDHATLLAGFGGAVIGSVLSALVSFILAKQASAETLLRDFEARLAEQKSYVLRLMVKASVVLSDLVAIRKAIDESLSNANDRNLTAEPLWKRVLPIVGSYQTFDIDAAELSPLIAAKDNALMQASVTLFMQHRNLIEAVRVYADLRGRVKEIVVHHFGSSEGVLTSGLTQEQMSKLMPLEIELESLIKTIRAMLTDLIPLAEKVTFEIGPAMQKFFGSQDFPVFAPKGAGEE
ncbi:hypothetical protein MesoLj113a_41810 [Mesorhizobium sp. 113-1-2]|uniref:hypothetical protein n=1 Tax=Mesorhizobium sp. 113-1-2 TaxID=2744515 RepID=UPI0008199525|nr:hypothetical protein [Mesorhizobium sp. 113-1-2]BAV45733.1 Uncharacterized protein MLTONO_0830 [Mesorhizobium loti]BCG73023.1 hypothetical protein MesoLj113a_41810 [Mesorhizobium sp. 113-1-2]